MHTKQQYQRAISTLLILLMIFSAGCTANSGKDPEPPVDVKHAVPNELQARVIPGATVKYLLNEDKAEETVVRDAIGTADAALHYLFQDSGVTFISGQIEGKAFELTGTFEGLIGNEEQTETSLYRGGFSQDQLNYTFLSAHIKQEAHNGFGWTLFAEDSLILLFRDEAYNVYILELLLEDVPGNLDLTLYTERRVASGTPEDDLWLLKVIEPFFYPSYSDPETMNVQFPHAQTKVMERISEEDGKEKREVVVISVRDSLTNVGTAGLGFAATNLRIFEYLYLDGKLVGHETDFELRSPTHDKEEVVFSRFQTGENTRVSNMTAAGNYSAKRRFPDFSSPQDKLDLRALQQPNDLLPNGYELLAEAKRPIVLANHNDNIVLAADTLTADSHLEKHAIEVLEAVWNFDIYYGDEWVETYLEFGPAVEYLSNAG